MSGDTLMLVLTAIAAVGGITGALLLGFAWLDRPVRVWGVRTERPMITEINQFPGGFDESIRPAKPTERHEATFFVRPEGTADVFDVRIRLAGLRLMKAPEGLSATRMTPGVSPPLEVRTVVPDHGESAAFLEIHWLQLRPHRHHAQRLNVHTEQVELWRWKWRSLRRRGRRLMRTDGRWVARLNDGCQPIPETDPSIGTPTVAMQSAPAE